MEIDYNKNEAEIDDSPGANLVECKLTCDERLNLAKKALQLMDDVLRNEINFVNNRAAVSSLHINNASKSRQITGATGSHVEFRNELQEQLRRIVLKLSAQAETIKSAQSKI